MNAKSLSGISAQEIIGLALPLLKNTEFFSFALGIRCKEEEREAMRKGIQKELVLLLEKKLEKKIDFEKPDVFILVDFLKNNFEISIAPVFVKGRYNKFSRELAQTFHYCRKCRGKGCKECGGTGKKTQESVQELIAEKAEKFFEASGNRFHGQGREDVDVLMLGKGRPFVLELIGPKKRNANLKALEKEINADNRIEVSELEFSNPKEMVEIKNAVHEKIYKAAAESEKEISDYDLKKIIGKEIEIVQRTPLRVAKRRPDLERKKHAKILEAKKISEKEFSVKILASHGLYIKEFVSGDSERTNPSISSLLGKNCACKRLDVLEIVS